MNVRPLACRSTFVLPVPLQSAHPENGYPRMTPSADFFFSPPWYPLGCCIRRDDLSCGNGKQNTIETIIQKATIEIFLAPQIFVLIFKPPNTVDKLVPCHFFTLHRTSSGTKAFP
jgi:hypothetical protein